MQGDANNSCTIGQPGTSCVDPHWFDPAVKGCGKDTGLRIWMKSRVKYEGIFRVKIIKNCFSTKM